MAAIKSPFDIVCCIVCYLGMISKETAKALKKSAFFDLFAFVVA